MGTALEPAIYTLCLWTLRSTDMPVPTALLKGTHPPREAFGWLPPGPHHREEWQGWIIMEGTRPLLVNSLPARPSHPKVTSSNSRTWLQRPRAGEGGPSWAAQLDSPAVSRPLTRHWVGFPGCQSPSERTDPAKFLLLIHGGHLGSQRPLRGEF